MFDRDLCDVDIQNKSDHNVEANNDHNNVEADEENSVRKASKCSAMDIHLLKNIFNLFFKKNFYCVKPIIDNEKMDTSV